MGKRPALGSAFVSVEEFKAMYPADRLEKLVEYSKFVGNHTLLAVVAEFEERGRVRLLYSVPSPLRSCDLCPLLSLQSPPISPATTSPVVSPTPGYHKAQGSATPLESSPVTSFLLLTVETSVVWVVDRHDMFIAGLLEAAIELAILAFLRREGCSSIIELLRPAGKQDVRLEAFAHENRIERRGLVLVLTGNAFRPSVEALKSVATIITERFSFAPSHFTINASIIDALSSSTRFNVDIAGSELRETVGSLWRWIIDVDTLPPRADDAVLVLINRALRTEASSLSELIEANSVSKCSLPPQRISPPRPYDSFDMFWSLSLHPTHLLVAGRFLEHGACLSLKSTKQEWDYFDGFSFSKRVYNPFSVAALSSAEVAFVTVAGRRTKLMQRNLDTNAATELFQSEHKIGPCFACDSDTLLVSVADVCTQIWRRNHIEDKFFFLEEHAQKAVVAFQQRPPGCDDVAWVEAKLQHSAVGQLWFGKRRNYTLCCGTLRKHLKPALQADVQLTLMLDDDIEYNIKMHVTSAGNLIVHARHPDYPRAERLMISVWSKPLKVDEIALDPSSHSTVAILSDEGFVVIQGQRMQYYWELPQLKPGFVVKLPFIATYHCCVAALRSNRLAISFSDPTNYSNDTQLVQIYRFRKTVVKLEKQYELATTSVVVGLHPVEDDQLAIVTSSLVYIKNV